MKIAPGKSVIIRDGEWMIKKWDSNSYGSYTLQCVGVLPLVKDKPAYFISDLEQRIDIVDPAKTQLIVDDSPHFNRGRLYLESQWRQMIPTNVQLHIGHKAVMNVVPWQLEPARISLRRPNQRILVVTVKSMMNQFQKEMPLKSAIQTTDADGSQEAMTAERCLL